MASRPPMQLPSYESSQLVYRITQDPYIPAHLVEETTTEPLSYDGENIDDRENIGTNSNSSWLSGNAEFVFSPIGPCAMFLLPPADDQDARPLYYITVQQNCFAPLSHITTVYRGPSEAAPRVGDFEMGIMALPGERQLGNRPSEKLEHVLTKMGRSSANHWRWARHASPGYRYSYIFWDCDVVPFVCRIEDQNRKPGTPVCWYTPSRTIKRTGASAPLSRLEVSPQGRVIMDDIIMSILAIERRLLQPPVKSLFNFS